MINVNPLRNKYVPEGGDTVVGRIIELGDKH
jgi:exosome complex RNA-binding protein Rrp4